MDIHFVELTEPTPTLVNALNRWENDSSLIPFTRPIQNKEELERQEIITLDNLKQCLTYKYIYLIYLDNQLIGEMNYMIDPTHLYKKESGTAWIGITIGEPEGRGKGIGYKALQFLEQEIKQHGFNRIELGVFEFNTPAHTLYQKLEYTEIGRIANFTYWQDKMWADIRMEKYL